MTTLAQEPEDGGGGGEGGHTQGHRGEAGKARAARGDHDQCDKTVWRGRLHGCQGKFLRGFFSKKQKYSFKVGFLTEMINKDDPGEDKFDDFIL